MANETPNSTEFSLLYTPRSDMYDCNRILVSWLLLFNRILTHSLADLCNLDSVVARQDDELGTNIVVLECFNLNSYRGSNLCASESKILSNRAVHISNKV